MTHWKRISLALVLILLAGSVVQAQEPRFTAYSIGVEDDFADVESIVNHIPSSGSIADIQNNSIETGESAHSCRNSGANVGSHSVWFALYFAGGTLVIDTNGSDYNTVMSVYPAAGSFATLSAVACNDDQSGINNAARISQALPAGIYYVQVSRYEAAPAGGPFTLQIAISAAFSGTAPANDNFANAQTIRLNETLTVNNIQYSTEEAQESDKTCGNSKPTHSVWFKLTQPANILALNFSLTTDGSLLNYGRLTTIDTVIDIFYGVSLAALTPVICNDDAVATYAALTNQAFPMGVDTLYIRVSTFTTYNLVRPSSYKLKVTVASYGVFNADPSFETDPLTQWTLSNANNGDGQLCNVPDTTLDGVCSIRFVGGPDERTALKQNVTLPAELLFKKKQLIGLAFAVKASDPATSFKGKVKITYSDGTPATKVTVSAQGSQGPGFVVLQELEPLISKKVSGMKVVFKNKSAAGTVYLDPVLVQLIGTLARDAAPAGVLPVPPAP